MIDFINGKPRFRAWPRKRGKSVHPNTKRENERFANAQRATKYLAPGIYKEAIRSTQQTPLLPRDVLTMMLYNRLWAFDLDDGRTLYPMPSINDISNALDVLGDAINSVLLRTDEGWRAFPYTTAEPKGALVYRTSNQTLPGGAQTRINFQAAEYDDLGLWNVSAPDRFTIPAGFTRARLSGHCGFTSSSGQSFLALGSVPTLSLTAPRGAAAIDTDTAGQDYLTLQTAWMRVSPGDTFGMYASPSSASAANGAWMAIEVA